MRDGYGALRQPKFGCGCCGMLVFRVCGARYNFYVFIFTATLNLMTGFMSVLLTSMSAVLAEDVHASLLFVGDLNGHHREWPGSTTTNHQLLIS